MQSSSRSRPFKPGLIGASPITDASASGAIPNGKSQMANEIQSICHFLFAIGYPRTARCSQGVISLCTPL
jgi:hypothetical protein